MALQKTVTLIYNTTTQNPVAKIPLCPGSFFGSGNLRIKIAWGDGETDEIVDTAALEQGRSIFHRYSSTGDHWVVIHGGYGDTDEERKLAFNKGDQRGENDLLNFKVLKTHEHFYMHGQGDFLNAKKMTYIAGAGNLKILKSANPDNIALTNTGTYYLNDTFAGCEVFEGTGIVNLFDTTDCTKMSGTFRNTLNFKGYIKGWNTQNVTDMSSMFEGSSFNQSIADWNVDNVVTTANMFKDTTAFNQWIAVWFEGGVKQLQDVSGMFEGSVFNSKLAGWNMQSVKTTANMFKNSKFNLFIGNWFKPGAGKSFVIEDMSGMFEGSDFTGKIASWDMQTVKTISGMFKDNNKFNQYIDSWFKPGAGKSFVIEDISSLLEGNTAFTGKIPSWDLRTVKNASNVFKNNTTYPNHWLNGWFQKGAGKVYNLENISGMFEGSSWNNKIADWDLSKVKDISYLFKNKSTWTQWVDNLFPASNVVENMDGLFEGASINPKCTSWKFNNVKTANDALKNSTVLDQYIEGWFKNSTQLESTSGMFEGSSWNGSLNQWNMSNVKDVSNMFKNNTAFNGFIEGWFSGTGHVVENMSSMFEGSSYNGKLAGWKLHSSVKNIDNMFKDTTVFNKYIEGWFTAANVLESAAGMFENAAAYNEKITNWNMSGVKNVSGMFKNNTTFTGYIEPWFNQSNEVEDLSSMFEGSTYTGKLVEWKLPSAKTTSNMFKDASFDGYIKNWFKYDTDTTFAIEDMSGMFSGSSLYGTDANTSKGVNQWDVRSVKNAAGMFEGNDNFGAWMKNWNHQGKDHGFENIQYHKNFSTKSDWGGAPWLPGDRVETLTGETEKTLNVASDESVTGRVTIVAADGIGNLTYSDTTTDTPGSIYVETQPTGGTVSLSADGVDQFNWLYDLSYSTYTIGDDTFTLTLVDGNGKKTTFDPLKVTIGKSNPGDVGDQPEPPAQVEARWHDVQVTRDGQSVATKVLQLKNLLQPTNESFTNQTTEWWTVYGFTGNHEFINLDGAFWADAGVIDTYGDTHPTSITLPDDAGTIEFTAHSSNNGYLQATLTLADGYKFDDDEAHGGLAPQTTHLFLTMADINSDSAQLLGTYPLAMKSADTGGGEFEPEPGDSVTGTGYMTGDLALIVPAGPNFSGDFRGEIEFHDDTHGANEANGYDADNYAFIMYPGSTSWGSLSFRYSTDTYKWTYTGYLNDSQFRGDVEFDLQWVNDRSAELIKAEANGEIVGAQSTYSDPSNGVVGTYDEEGTVGNFTITSDGTTPIGQLLDNEGYYVSWEWYEGQMDEDMGWPTHVYPNGTVIEFTGGKDSWLEPGTEDYTIAYEQNNTQKIKIRVQDAVNTGDGDMTGDVDVSMLYTDGYFQGNLNFTDPDGADHLSDPSIGGWYTAGSNAKPGTTPRGEFQLMTSSISDVGRYNYNSDTNPDGVYPYTDEFQVTWYDDIGFLNTHDVKITVTAPQDSEGVWSGDTTIAVDGIADVSNWSPGDNVVNGTLTLDDDNGISYNQPTVTSDATKGTFTISSYNSNGNSGSIYWSYWPSDSTAGAAHTDNVTLEWGDQLNNKYSVELTFNISDASSGGGGGGGGGGGTGSYTGATGDVTAYNSMNGDYGDNAVVNGTLAFDDYDSNWFITDISQSSYPNHGFFTWYSGSYGWQYQLNDGAMGGPTEATTDEFEVVYNMMNMQTYSTVSVTVTHVINIAAPSSGGGGGGGGADQPGTTSGDINLSVGSNTDDNPSGNVAYGYLTYQDPDGTMMNYGMPEAIVTPPTKGVASINYSALTYTPNPNEQGTDQFTISWSDDLGNTNEQVISVTIIDMSDKPIISSGDKTITAVAPPTSQHMGDTSTFRATGTLTISDENNLNTDLNSYQINSIDSAEGYYEVVSVTSVSQSEVSLVWGYTPGPAESTGDKQFTLTVYDDMGYMADIGLTATVTHPAQQAISPVGTPTQLAVTAQKNNNSTVAYADGQGPTMVVFETPHGVPTVNTPAGYIATVNQSSTLNQYEVSIDIDVNHTFTPVDPMVPINTTANVEFVDGYGRSTGSKSVNVQINAYVDVPGTLTLKDPFGSGDFTDEYGQSLATDSQGVQTITLYKPAPMLSGLIMIGEIADDDGYDINTVTTKNNTANVEVISGPADGQYRLELTAESNSTTGTIDIEWSDMLNNVYTKTINVVIEALPNIPGVLHGVYDDEGNKLNQNTDGDWIAVGESSDAFAVTIQVQDANELGSVSITGQPSTGTATVTETGGSYMVTYTPPASPTIWPDATVEVTWNDLAGNQNDPITIIFERGSDEPGDGSADSNPAAPELYQFQNGFGEYIAPGSSLEHITAGDTVSRRLLLVDMNGFPTENNLVTYNQPVFVKQGESNSSVAGVLTITENNAVSVPSDINTLIGDQNKWSDGLPVAAKDVTGGDRYTARVFDVTFTAVNDIGDGEETEVLHGTIGFQSYWFDDEDAIQIENLNFGIGPILADPVDDLVLEYADDNIDLAHLPTHNGTASVTGNIVTISNLSQYGGGVVGNADKTALQQKLVRVHSFGNFANMNWNKAFQNATSLNQVPIKMEGTPISMQSMFEGCTTISTINADMWDMSNVTDISRMFYGCTNLSKLYARWDTSSVTSMTGVFAYTGFTSLADIVGLFPNSPTGWDLSGVTSLAGMFEGSLLTSFTWESTQDTSNVTDFSNMFAGSHQLQTVDLSNLDTSSATNLSGMFDGCTALTTVNATNLNATGVTDVTSMFKNTSSLTSVTGMTNANFASATSSSFTDMFKGSALSATGPNITGWKIPNVSELPSDIAGAGADISGWTIPLSLDPDAPELNVTLRYQDAQYDGDPESLVLENYFNPQSLEDEGVYYDWRGSMSRFIEGSYPNQTIAENPAGSYFVMTVNTGGQSFEFMMYAYFGAHFLNGWSSSGDLELVPVTVLNKHNEWPSSFNIKQETGDELVFSQSKPSWITSDMFDDHKFVISHDDSTLLTNTQKQQLAGLENATWLGLNTPTRAQLNAALPTDGTDNVSIKITAHSTETGDDPIVVIDNYDLQAERLMKILQNRYTGIYPGTNMMNPQYPTHLDLITIPTGFGRVQPDLRSSGPGGSSRYYSPMAINAPELNIDTIQQYMDGDYDASSTFNEVAIDPIVLMVEQFAHVRVNSPTGGPKRLYYETLGDLLESPFIPEFSMSHNGKTISSSSLVSGYKNIDTPTTAYIKSGSYHDKITPSSGGNATIGAFVINVENNNTMSDMGISAALKHYFTYIRNNGEITPPADGFTPMTTDSSIEFTYTSKYETFVRNRYTTGELFTKDGTYGNYKGHVQPNMTDDIEYVQYNWSSTDRVFIEQNNVSRAWNVGSGTNQPYYVAPMFVYDFDPDEEHGLSNNERYLMYVNHQPVNVPTNLKAFPLKRRTDLAKEMFSNWNVGETANTQSGYLSQISVVGGKYNATGTSEAQIQRIKQNHWNQVENDKMKYTLAISFDSDSIASHPPELSNSVDINNTDGDNGSPLAGLSSTWSGSQMTITLDTEIYNGNPMIFLKCGAGHSNMGSHLWIQLPENMLQYNSQLEDVPGTEDALQSYVSQYGFINVHEAMLLEPADGPLTQHFGNKSYYGGYTYRDSSGSGWEGITGGQLYYVYPDGQQKARKVRMYKLVQTSGLQWSPMNNWHSNTSSHAMAQTIDNILYGESASAFDGKMINSDALSWMWNIYPDHQTQVHNSPSLDPRGLWYNYRSDTIDLSNYSYTLWPKSETFKYGPDSLDYYLGLPEEQSRIIE